MLRRVVAAGLCLGGAQAVFYLPGVAPRDFVQNEKVDLKVNHLDSTVTQMNLEYYTLPFCQPKVIVEASENLGEVMAGNIIENSDYEIFMNKVESCKTLCKKKLDADELAAFERRIKEEYSVNWIVDNIPGSTLYKVTNINEETGDQDEFVVAEKGFALGYQDNGEVYLNNHVRINLDYHSTSEGYRIVGFEVIPFSVDHSNFKCDALHIVNNNDSPMRVSGATQSKHVTFSYDVMWKPSEVKWASRWDIYLRSTNSNVHWFAISNSFALVVFVTAVIATTLARALQRDMTRYNSMDELDEDELLEREEELGWKQVHADVFRPPAGGAWLSVMVGSGVQLWLMSFITIMFACAGLLSPANRGGLMTAFLVLFVFMGLPAGYTGARMHKMLDLPDWKRNAMRISLFFPGIAFTIFFILNLFVWEQHSSNAVPFGTLVSLLVMWLGISLPLTLSGAYVGNRKAKFQPPTKVNHLARVIPADQPWILKSWTGPVIAGVVPFGSVFIEVFFIISSVWEHQFYYMFGILAIVFVLLVITCAEMSIFICYYTLVHENYNWWWRAFNTSGSFALYFFAYCIHYFMTQLHIVAFVPSILFFGYMFLVSFAFYLLTGTIGFLCTVLFIRKIYSTIKID